MNTTGITQLRALMITAGLVWLKITEGMDTVAESGRNITNKHQVHPVFGE